MKSIVFLVVLIATKVYAADLKISAAVFNGSAAPFLRHEGPGQFDNYLSMNILFSPVLNLFHQVETTLQRKLISRGEAHITVITPIEYWNVLRHRKISMRELNYIAERFNIQKSRFSMLCLGQGNAIIDNKIESTFFIVVNSPDLINLRKAIQALFIQRGGLPNQFDPNNYYPHITVGFTKTDLHESNGVIKNTRSCVGRIGLVQ